MRSLRTFLGGLVLAGGLLATTAALPVSASAKPAALSSPIVIGSTNFGEQQILAYLYSDVLVHAGFKTTVRGNLGTRAEVEPAFAHGSIDLYPEYAGSLLLFLDAKAGTKANSLTTDIPLLNSYLKKVGATSLTPAPAIDTNVFAVTQATRKKYHLTNLSSLKPYASKLILGGPSERPTNYPCEPGLKKVYGLNFKSFAPLDEAGPLSVLALKENRAQVVEFFSSDGTILKNDFYALADNLDLQPADHILPVIRNSVDSAKAKSVLNKLSAKLTTNVLASLNLKEDANKSPSTTASAWLKSVGLT